MENGQSVFFLSPYTPYGRVRFARLACVRLIRHALPISLLILGKKPTVLQSTRQVPWVPETFLARFPVQSLARLNHLVQFGKFGKSMISNVLEGFDGVDKLKAMSKQVEYLISFSPIKLLSRIQLL